MAELCLVLFQEMTLVFFKRRKATHPMLAGRREVSGAGRGDAPRRTWAPGPGRGRQGRGPVHLRWAVVLGPSGEHLPGRQALSVPASLGRSGPPGERGHLQAPGSRWPARGAPTLPSRCSPRRAALATRDRARVRSGCGGEVFRTRGCTSPSLITSLTPPCLCVPGKIPPFPAV